MSTWYCGMVRKKDQDPSEAIPVKWTGENYYTQDLEQLKEMLKHMSWHFPNNVYTIKEENFD